VNVLFLSTGLGTGGAERSLLRLSSALLARGLRPAVVCLSRQTELLARFEEAGVETMVLDLGSPAGWRDGWQRFQQWRGRRRPDVIQGWMYHGNLAASLLSRGRLPVSWSVRQTLNGNRDSLRTRAVIRGSALLSRTARCIVYNSAAARHQHEERGFATDKGCVIHNGVDMTPPSTDARDHARRLFNVAESAVVVGHVARLHPSKDHRSFLVAFSQLARAQPRAVAVLAGRGVDAATPELAVLIDRLGVREKVRLLGPRADIDALYAGFDVFCMSSSAMEGFPNVVAEAMAAGVPCVVTRVGDASQMVGDTGHVVSPGDPTAMAVALGDVVALDPIVRRQLGECARARVAREFTVEQMTDRFVALYERLVGPPTH
jgi:glycosyltransferase involved in cell wall biosynthesis